MRVRGKLLTKKGACFSIMRMFAHGGDRGQSAYGARPPLGFYLVTIIFWQFRKYDTIAHSSMHLSRKHEACKSKTEKLRDEN